MCGIAGIVSNNSHSFANHLSRMMDRIKHRGPDGEGVFFYDTCALGHRRLSIVDLATGNQPMLSPSGKRAIIFNGEIYGYKEIKNSLKEYPFITTSDTEVMLALYDKYGNGFLKYLPGMFAFAIWNDEKKELFCARDRFGEKPFYYATSARNEFVFASEIKAILASGLIQPVLDRSALKHFLKHLYVHPYQTIFKNIFTLPPAHSLLLKDGKIFVEKYWNLPDTNEKINLNEAEERFRNLFSTAVEKQLVADVPVGAFLSGGIDSSSIVGFAGEKKRGIHTFSFGFEEGVNELPFAKIIAEKFQTHHTELEDKHED
ncbi:MAG: asparagine synthase (glutamine-hydrolyzing), partial [Bacteroidota bacterium]